MKRICVLILSVIALISVDAAQKQRPNFVFVLVDDLRVGALGCEGHPFSKTPNIDRLAHEGALFRNAFVTTPLCSPSRGSFLTGQYVRKHGVLDNDDFRARSHELITFPMLLRKAGYESAFIGKWHMGTHDEPKPGYDRWVSFKGQGVYENPLLNIDGTTNRVTGYITDILSDYAVDFIKREHQKPFVLYLGHKAVHGPFSPAPRHKDLYANQTLPSAPASVKDSLQGKPALKHVREDERKAHPAAAQPKKELPRTAVLSQLRCLKSIDEGVGKMIAALEQTGQLDNTLFIFTSDNGYFWGEHGLGDKRWGYEESIRVPLVMRYPKLIAAGSTPEQVALNIDIAPTLLDLAGVRIPRTMQGKSLVPVLKGRKWGWRDSAFFEYFVDRQYPRFPEWQAIRSPEWKYIHYPTLSGADELYNLRADPGEMTNLVDDVSAKKTLEKLKAQLTRSVAAAGK